MYVCSEEDPVGSELRFLTLANVREYLVDKELKYVSSTLVVGPKLRCKALNFRFQDVGFVQEGLRPLRLDMLLPEDLPKAYRTSTLYRELAHRALSVRDAVQVLLNENERLHKMLHEKALTSLSLPKEIVL